jgi:hypothetical protein
LSIVIKDTNPTDAIIKILQRVQNLERFECYTKDMRELSFCKLLASVESDYEKLGKMQKAILKFMENNPMVIAYLEA